MSHVTDETPYTPGAIAVEVLLERAAQDAKWGEQNHRDGTGGYPLKTTTVNLDFRTASELRAIFRDRCERRFRDGVGGWLDILLEEVFEAAAETDAEKLRTELIQVAAVATAWVEAIYRRGNS